ncbi:hypothetical protein Tco_1538623 [Tanacetum coccineum]
MFRNNTLRIQDSITTIGGPGLRIRHDRLESSRHWPEGSRDGGVFNRLGDTKASTEIEIAGEITPITWFSTRSTLIWRHPWDQYTTAFLKILAMSEQAELNLTPPTSAVRNTMGKGKEQTLKNSGRPVSDAALREYCDKYYHQLLPIIAEKVHQEKMQQEKLKEEKTRLNFEGCSGKNSKIQEVSQHSESRTLDARDLRRKLRSRRSHSISGSPERNPNVFSRI